MKATIIELIDKTTEKLAELEVLAGLAGRVENGLTEHECAVLGNLAGKLIQELREMSISFRKES